MKCKNPLVQRSAYDDKLTFGSIEYGIGILQGIQSESKSLKKSLKVIFFFFPCFAYGWIFQEAVLDF